MTDENSTIDHDHPDTQGGARPKTTADITEEYASVADDIERWSWLERRLSGRYRRLHFEQARGNVLDVACGTGSNIPHLPQTIDYVGIDISPEMLAKAKEKLGRFTGDVAIRQMDAQDLDFADDEFDTVISALSTCTFPDPVAALNEMGRVCKPDGRILLLEHGRGDCEPLARFLDWRSDAHYRKTGCRWNQEPLSLVQSSNLSSERSNRWVFGVLTAIEATPP